MKLNEHLIKRLASAEIQLFNTGTSEQKAQILKAAIPSFFERHPGFIQAKKQEDSFEYYLIYKNVLCVESSPFNVPVFKTHQFFETNPRQCTTPEEQPGKCERLKGCWDCESYR